MAASFLRSCIGSAPGMLSSPISKLIRPRLAVIYLSGQCYLQSLTKPHQLNVRSYVSSISRSESHSNSEDLGRPRSGKQKHRLEKSPEGSVTEIEVPGNGTFTFSNLWLRDNCPCKKCTHPQTKQRQHKTFDIPFAIGIKNLWKGSEGIKIQCVFYYEQSPKKLLIQRQGDNDGHESEYSWEWLRSWKGSFGYHDVQREEKSRAWKYVSPARPDLFPAVSFEEIMNGDKGVATWTKKIYEYGFSFVGNCPETPSATKSLLERIAFIQNTQYGGFWDFTSSKNPIDTAYTDQPLDLHTDTTYLSIPCGLQMFHLLSHTEGTGGESLFVDGYAAAKYLRDHHPNDYKVFCREKVLFHASGNPEMGKVGNSAIYAQGSPIFSAGGQPDQETMKTVTTGLDAQAPDSRRIPSLIRWNNDDRDNQTWRSLRSLENWYRAARTWNQILNMEEFQIKLQLKPGHPIIFDNWRYLHGRTGFSGERRICGGYISMDHFLARYRMTNFGPRTRLSQGFAENQHD